MRARTLFIEWQDAENGNELMGNEIIRNEHQTKNDMSCEELGLYLEHSLRCIMLVLAVLRIDRQKI